jgi:hypothetical protein
MPSLSEPWLSVTSLPFTTGTMPDAWHSARTSRTADMARGERRSLSEMSTWQTCAPDTSDTDR